MINKKDMTVDLESNTIDIPTIGTVDIELIINAYERIQQKKGIEAAKSKGDKYKGRKPLEEPEDFREYMSKVEAKDITVVDAVKELNISRASYYRLKDKIKKGLL